MRKCVCCGVYFDDYGEGDATGALECSVCRAAWAPALFRVRRVLTGQYLRFEFSQGTAFFDCAWCADREPQAWPRDVAEALAKCLIHASGDAGIEVEPVEN